MQLYIGRYLHAFPLTAPEKNTNNKSHNIKTYSDYITIYTKKYQVETPYLVFHGGKGVLPMSINLDVPLLS